MVHSIIDVWICVVPTPPQEFHAHYIVRDINENSKEACSTGGCPNGIESQTEADEPLYDNNLMMKQI